MTYSSLAADVPLGPFEGTGVTVWAAAGAKAKLHASPSCSFLRSSHPTQRHVALDAATVGRMCTQCARYSFWVRPGTGLAVFLECMTGIGLQYELGSYRAADEDSYSDEEIEQAALLLHSSSREEGSVEDDDEEEDFLDQAQQVREAVFREWRGALASLQHAQQILGFFPWLREWAQPQVQSKQERLAVLRAQAARLVRPEALAAVAAVAMMDEPDVPAEDSACAVLGAPEQARRRLLSWWRHWRSRVEGDCALPFSPSYYPYVLAEGISSRRKGYQQLLERAQVLLEEWQDAARSAAIAGGGEQVVLVRLPDFEEPEADPRLSPIDRVSAWELGVLAAYTVTVNEEQLVFTLRVPEPVAARLLSQHTVLSCSGQEEAAAGAEVSGRDVVLEPGVFDDTPVHARRVLEREHLRALRATGRVPEQLYAVFSPETGVDVVALSVLEERCAAGWRGVILAGARDLPEALFPSGADSFQEAKEESGRVWASPVHDPWDPQFGHTLSRAEGERVLVRLSGQFDDSDQALRSLALARGVADLRALDAETYDRRGWPTRAFPADVWHGLLAMEQLRLAPFRPATARGRQGGLALPLGVLAAVQIYTTDTAGQWEGRAHSPDCSHRRPDRGATSDDEMVTVEAFLTCEGFDPCSKCGGYAIRRLTDTQVAYYRAAHQLHDLSQRVRSDAFHPSPGTREKLETALGQLEGLDPDAVSAWLPDYTQVRGWWQAVRQVRHDLTHGSTP